MKWKELSRINEAPEKGWMLAYLRKDVRFERYDSLEDVAKCIGQDRLLELHLFDQDKEYRCIASQSKRYPSGIVEAVAAFEEDGETVYAEEIYLEKKYQKYGEKIRLLNHLEYDENGMLKVDDYRLIMKEG